MIRIANLAQINAGLDKWVDDIDDLLEGAFRGMVIETFKFILEATPEWSGALAASWRLTVGAPAVGYDEPTIFKDVVFSIGGERDPYSKLDRNQAALHYAKEIAKLALPFIRGEAPVFITNNAPYAENVELNKGAKGAPFIRLVNLPSEMVEAAKDRWGRYGRLTEAKAIALGLEHL